MLSPQINDMLLKLKEDIQSGRLTEPSSETGAIGPGTYLCLVENTVTTPIYYQLEFEKLHKDWQAKFKGKRKGDQIDKFKIIAVMDCWE